MAGRPPIGERAMTAAERQRKRRDALRAQQPAQPKPKAQTVSNAPEADVYAQERAQARERIKLLNERVWMLRRELARNEEVWAQTRSKHMDTLRKHAERISELEQQLREQAPHQGGSLDAAVRRRLLKAAHPDTGEKTLASLRVKVIELLTTPEEARKQQERQQERDEARRRGRAAYEARSRRAKEAHARRKAKEAAASASQ